MTVKDSGYYFTGEYKATETIYKEVFLAFLAVLLSKDLFSYSTQLKKKQSKRKLQILTQDNGLTPLEISNMATPTNGLCKRSVRPIALF